MTPTAPPSPDGTVALDPDALRAVGACTLGDDGCSVCGEAAVPVRVIGALPSGSLRVADRTGATADVLALLTPDARVGDVLLVSHGVALARIASSPLRP